VSLTWKPLRTGGEIAYSAATDANGPGLYWLIPTWEKADREAGLTTILEVDGPPQPNGVTKHKSVDEARAAAKRIEDSITCAT